MKNKIKILANITLTLMIFITLNAKIVLITQASSDGKMPVFVNGKFVSITKGKVNKDKVKKGDTFQYSFTIMNTGLDELQYRDYTMSFLEAQNIRIVELVWQSPKKQSIIHRYTGKYDQKTKTYKISGKIKINKGMQQGKWKLESIAMYSLNVYDLGDDDFDSGYANIYNTNARNKHVADKYSEFVDLSFADFTVSGTGKKVDKEGPTISAKSLKLSKKVLKKETKSKFSVKVKDQSGMIRSVTCAWMFYGKKYDKYGEEYSFKMKYNKKKKVYEYKIPVSLWEKKAKLKRIVLEDYYGNKRGYYWDDGVREYWSSEKMDEVKKKKKKEFISSWGEDFNGKSKSYSLKKKDKKVFNSMVITRKKKYIKK